MGRLVSAINPLLDAPPADTAALGQGSLLQRLRALWPLLQAGVWRHGDPHGDGVWPSPWHWWPPPGAAMQVLELSFLTGLALGRQLPHFYEVLTAPISKVCASSSGTSLCAHRDTATDHP